MGDTGSELSGLLILILAGFALLWFAGNKLIDKIEARRKKAETTTVTAGSISSIKAKKSFKYNLITLFGLLVLLSGAVLVLMLNRSQPPVYAQGQIGVIPGWSLQVTEVSFAAKIPGLDSAQQTSLSWLLVNMEIKNLTSDPHAFDRAKFFQVEDSRLDAYSPEAGPPVQAYLNSLDNNALNSPFKAGEERKVILAFKVDPSASGLDLVYLQEPKTRFHLTPGVPR